MVSLYKGKDYRCCFYIEEKFAAAFEFIKGTTNPNADIHFSDL
jgi:hypothetical protein